MESPQETEKVMSSNHQSDRVMEPKKLPLSHSTEPSGEDLTLGHLDGWKLYLLSLSLSLVMFLVNIEVSIVATSLYSISSDLKGFSELGWIVTGYLTTYTSTIIIWSRFSDIFGRKTCILIAMAIFVGFSGGCGGAQTMNQLIICRCFQGLGAAGCNSLALTIAYEAVPQHKYPTYAALLISMTALGSLVGPLVGGALSTRDKWRWSFLFNVPTGSIVLVLLFLSLPNRFPFHANPTAQFQISRFSSFALRRLDVLGATLLLASSLLLVTALLGGGTEFAWSSATAIALLVISGVTCGLFILNEYTISKSHHRQNPIFPWNYLFNRAWMATLLVSFFAGIPYIVTMIDIPQRFQAVYRTSPLQAGIRLIPFNFVIALGSVLVNVIVAKTRIPAIILLFVGTVLQIVGISLISFLPAGPNIPAAIYGYEVLAGLGIGTIIGLTLVLPPLVTNSSDFAMLAGAVLQFRIFGGAIGLAVALTVGNNYFNSHVRDIVTDEQRGNLLKSVEFISQIRSETQARVLKILVDSYNLRMRSLIAFSAAQFVAVALLWKKQQIIIKKNSDEATEPDSLQPTAV